VSAIYVDADDWHCGHLLALTHSTSYETTEFHATAPHSTSPINPDIHRASQSRRAQDRADANLTQQNAPSHPLSVDNTSKDGPKPQHSRSVPDHPVPTRSSTPHCIPAIRITREGWPPGQYWIPSWWSCCSLCCYIPWCRALLRVSFRLRSHWWFRIRCAPS